MFRGKSMPTSMTQPADKVGQLIHVDTQSLHLKSFGGNLCYIDSIDEYSSDVHSTPAKSLESVDLFASIMEPVVAMVGAFGILLTFVPPGQHA